MTIKAFIRPPNVEQAWHPLMALSPGLRPEWFSSQEEITKAKARIEDSTKFQQFVNENRFGFFLFGERVRYNLIARRNDSFCTLSVDAINEGLTELDAIEIFNALCENGLIFAFAAHVDEYHHRNKYFRTIGANHFESWVGRDLSKYIPGIYWLTVLSEDYHQVLQQLPNLIADAGRMDRFGKKHWLIKAFEDINDWPQYAPKLDAWCAEYPEVFSLRRIRPQLDAAENIPTLSKLAAQWR